MLISDEYVEYSSVLALSGHNDLYLLLDLYDFLVWHFVASLRFQYNGIRGLGIVQC